MEALTDFIVQKKENGLTNFEVAEILKNYQRSKGESTDNLRYTVWMGTSVRQWASTSWIFLRV